MTSDNPKQIEAAKEFNQAIIAGLANEKGVHAETAISAAARMAGTFLLLSTGLPLTNFEAGRSILCDLVDEQGQEVLGLIDQALASMNVPFDPSRVDYDVPEAHSPMLDLMQTQALLDEPLRAIAGKYELADEESATALAIS